MCAWPLRVGLSLLLASVLLATIGCSEQIGDVSGEVKLKDKSGKEIPIETGTISFANQGRKKQVRTATIQKGKYEAKGVPVGKALVSIQGFAGELELPRETKGKDGKIKPPTVIKGKDGKPKPLPPAVNKRYGDPATSGLEYEVVAGDQEQNFTVDP